MSTGGTTLFGNFQIQVLPPGTTLWRNTGGSRQLVYTIDEVDMSEGQLFYRLSEEGVVVSGDWIIRSGLEIIFPPQQQYQQATAG